MLELIRNWQGKVEINGKTYDKVSDVPLDMPFFDGWSIKLLPMPQKTHKTENTQSDGRSQYLITVKKYMTQPASPEFDFMAKWNEDKPMPLRTMVGEKVKETRGMVYMNLHGDIWTTRITRCMKCGKILTNPVSQYFGIGPECGGHNYVNPFDSDEELQEAVKDYKQKLQKITWSGWIIKSAIIDCQKVDG